MVASNRAGHGDPDVHGADADDESVAIGADEAAKVDRRDAGAGCARRKDRARTSEGFYRLGPPKDNRLMSRFFW